NFSRTALMFGHKFPDVCTMDCPMGWKMMEVVETKRELSSRAQELRAIRLQHPASRLVNILFRDQCDVRRADVFDASAEQILRRGLNESGGHDHRRARRRRDVRRAAVVADEQAQPRG